MNLSISHAALCEVHPEASSPAGMRFQGNLIFGDQHVIEAAWRDFLSTAPSQEAGALWSLPHGKALAWRSAGAFDVDDASFSWKFAPESGPEALARLANSALNLGASASLANQSRERAALMGWPGAFFQNLGDGTSFPAPGLGFDKARHVLRAASVFFEQASDASFMDPAEFSLLVQDLRQAALELGPF
jgi:hypothetical protein